MADISTELQAILDAVYGEDVRGSIHDAIDIVNKVGEKNITVGTAVTSQSSSIEGYYDESVYINKNTWDVWVCDGTKWVLQGNIKGGPGEISWNEQAVLGAKNQLPPMQASSGIVTVDSEGIITINGNTTSDAWVDFYSPQINAILTSIRGDRKLTLGDTNAQGFTLMFYKSTSGSWQLSQSVKSLDVSLTDAEHFSGRVAIYLSANKTFENVKIYPMISFDGGEYAPYAMTNRELTEKATPTDITVTPSTDIELRPANMAKMVGNLLCLNLVIKNTGTGNKTSSDTLVTISGLNVTHSNNLVCLGVKTGDGTPKAFLLTHDSSTNTIVVKILNGNFAPDETYAINFVEAL